jgi:uncharacterized membrane protein YhaH (DUF805 family)
MFGATIAGIFAAVILSAAAGMVTSLFIIAIVLIPWLLWGLVIHTERLHDRNKSAWCPRCFFVIRARLITLPRPCGSTLVSA